MIEDDDMALFNSAVSGDAHSEAEVQQEAPETEAPEAEEDKTQARDESGRFAKSEPAQEEPKAEVAEEERKGFVPSSRHREEAEARRRAEAENAELRAQMKALMAMVGKTQQPQEQANATPELEPVDAILTDPKGFVQKMFQPLEQQRFAEREFYSRRLAEQQFGKEKVSEAYDALDAEIRAGRLNADAVLGHLRQSLDPYGEIMTWHKRNSIVSKMGDDPEAYINSEVERILAERMGNSGQAAQPQPPRNVVKIPQSLSRATSAANTSPGGAALSDADLFRQITARRA
jgi:hypothetical protein